MIVENSLQLMLATTQQDNKIKHRKLKTRMKPCGWFVVVIGGLWAVESRLPDVGATEHAINK